MQLLTAWDCKPNYKSHQQKTTQKFAQITQIQGIQGNRKAIWNATSNKHSEPKMSPGEHNRIDGYQWNSVKGIIIIYSYALSSTTCLVCYLLWYSSYIATIGFIFLDISMGLHSLLLPFVTLQWKICSVFCCLPKTHSDNLSLVTSIPSGVLLTGYLFKAFWDTWLILTDLSALLLYFSTSCNYVFISLDFCF